jgi:putative transposase
MPTQRKQFTAEFKAKIAVEAIRGVKTTSELASQYGVHPVQISQWKKQALDGLNLVFTDKRKKVSEDHEAVEDNLFQQIGRLKVELDWLKKKSGLVR